MFRPVGRYVATRISANSAGKKKHFVPSHLPVQRRLLFFSERIRYHSSSHIGKIEKPTYQLTFTCKACNRRSSHFLSKQAYHSGTVLIQCPDCRNRHLIADHLNVFGEGKKTLEDILKEKGDGETITRRTVDLNKIDLSKLGDIEWEGPGKTAEQHLLEK